MQKCGSSLSTQEKKGLGKVCCTKARKMRTAKRGKRGKMQMTGLRMTGLRCGPVEKISHCPSTVSCTVWKRKSANFQRIFLVSPTVKEGNISCVSTDWVRFRLFPSTAWIGWQCALDWFRVRFRYPLRWKCIREPRAKECPDSALKNKTKSSFGSFWTLFWLRTRPTTTRDRNLQFRAAVSTGFL